jgi:hypothetical protein
MVHITPLVGAIVAAIVIGFLIRKHGQIDPWM